MNARSVNSQGEFKKQVSESLRSAMQDQGLSVSKLALKVGTGRTAIRRILDPENTAFTFKSLCKVATAVGLQFNITSRPLAPKALGKMARRLAETSSRAEAKALSQEILAGFYGRANAAHSKKKSTKSPTRSSPRTHSRKVD